MLLSLVMMLVLRMLTTINIVCERMPRLRGMSLKLKTRSVMVAPRAKIVRCEGDRCV
jgi:hypothetical protein